MKSRFSADLYFRFRVIAVGLAVFLGLCGIVMGFSMFSALFGIGGRPVFVGGFFARSFGILSLLIPLHLIYAAFILADPHWRPDRIFLLGACIFPFLTLVAGFALIRDFDVKSAQYALLNFTGKTGFSLLIIFITVIEVLFLQVWKNRFFSRKERDDGQEVSGRETARGGAILLPPPETDLKPAELRPETELKPSVSSPAAFRPVAEEPPSAEEADDDSSELVLSAEELAEIAEIGNFDDIDDDGPFGNSVGVTRALKEAEAAAAIHSEQVRKKAAKKDSRSKKYKVPVEILNEYPDGEYWVIDQATRAAALALKETLEEFKIQADVTGIKKGPVITMFEILPAPGVKLSKIVGLQDNIALRLAASSVRIVAPIPGKHAVGIEVPNAKRNIVSFREIIEGELLRSDKQMEIPVVMGKDITGEAQTVDLVQMPHLLIAGATGSGKSVCVNSMILSILYQLHPSDCRLILIDPKIVELKLYNDIPHLLTPVITEPKKAFQALQYCIYEMERRYACLDSMGVRDIRSYNRRIKEKNIAQEHMPYIVVVIDEFADLMTTTGKELESTVARLAAMSRAVGIHLVLATQRPSIDVITGLIKANIPSRIAFMVASKTDSRIIIDMTGAEKLLGKGDMLYAGVVDPFPIRMQGAFVSEEEVEAVVEHVKSFGEPEYIDDEIFFEEEEEDSSASLFSDGDDPLYDKALEIVMQQGKASASYIQRRLKIGFNRAARLVDEMEHHGVVGPAQGSKPRELLRGFSA
jgi:S-DNA-T family DNA segregation ATPase FtsK/SpoIIIE